MLLQVTKLLRSIADTDGMDGRYIEPRKVIWAVAEIIGEDDSGTSFRVPAVLEDTSLSGACVRITQPLNVGSRLIIKWHREQFSGIARNCRKDGGDFLFRRAARDRNSLGHKASQPPGGSRRQSRMPYGKPRRIQTPRSRH